MARYSAQDIEVLRGLEPVQRRPGMYTDTTRPNHLAQEVIDNSVDEAIASFTSQIKVTVYADGSLEVIDDGRGMPVDEHPQHKVPGVELILTRLHTGGKFSNKNYQFSGGLHGVGISVVNALSKQLEVWIKRDGHKYHMQFEQGKKTKPLTIVDSVSRRNTGTTVRFTPETSYFDSAKFSLTKLKHVLRAKAVLCPGLHINFLDEKSGDSQSWYYEDGLVDYLTSTLSSDKGLPADSFSGTSRGDRGALDWALCWTPETNELLTESYVNLIYTAQGGTHVNGLRTGLLEALREFCELHDLLPRCVKLTSEDIWANCNYVLSVKLENPQFSGQTKERLTSRNCAAFVAEVIKDNFSLFLSQHVDIGQQLAEWVISQAQQRLKKAKRIARKKIAGGPALPGKLADCTSQDPRETELFLVEGDSAGGSAKQARDRRFQAIMPLRGKILNTWELDSQQVLGSQEIHNISVALDVDPGSSDLSGLRYGKICILADADSDGLHIATLLCALFLRHFRPLIEAGHVFVAMPPLYRIDINKEVFYALDDDEKKGLLRRIKAERKKGKVNVQLFKGLGEMNPMQLRETTMAVDTRRLVQLGLVGEIDAVQMLDKLLAKKRAVDRRHWLEVKGNLAEMVA